MERIVSGVTTLGPGKRIAIWVNGCNRACPGCISPRLQKFDESTECNIIDILGNYDLVNIDGITISGGEPFEQIDDLYDLVCYFSGIQIYYLIMVIEKKRMVSKNGAYFERI